MGERSSQMDRGGVHVGVKVELEGLDALFEPETERLRLCLDELDPKNGTGFLIVEVRNAYLQIGGGPKKFTLECRENSGSAEDFHHFVACDPFEKSLKPVVIYGNGTVFRVRKNEVLNRAYVEEILLAFVVERRRPTQFLWRDTSATF